MIKINILVLIVQEPYLKLFGRKGKKYSNI